MVMTIMTFVMTMLTMVVVMTVMMSDMLVHDDSNNHDDSTYNGKWLIMTIVTMTIPMFAVCMKKMKTLRKEKTQKAKGFRIEADGRGISRV